MAADYPLIIEQGKTFSRLLRWEVAPLVSKPITAISKAAPAVLTVTAHGIPGVAWRGAIAGVSGMTQINAATFPPRNSDFHKLAVVDANTLAVSDVNSAFYAAYTSGGFLLYNTPQSLVGYTARMSIKDKIGGAELLRLDTVAGRIVLDTVNFTVTLTVDAVTTAGLAWTAGVYDLELVSAGGVVTALIKGAVSVVPEVTTT